ncbi:hypothetical protein GCM10025734_40910 [Kitasatospora paranensis]
MDHLRRMRRRPVADLPVERLVELAAAEDTAGSALASVTTADALALIGRLPRDQAEAVLLRVLLGLDAESAARVLGKRAGTVRMAAHRGLKRLAKLLEPAGGAVAGVPRQGAEKRAAGCDTRAGRDAEGHEMSKNRSRRIDRDTAERLLGGERSARRPVRPPHRSRGPRWAARRRGSTCRRR